VCWQRRAFYAISAPPAKARQSQKDGRNVPVLPLFGRDGLAKLPSSQAAGVGLAILCSAWREAKVRQKQREMGPEQRSQSRNRNPQRGGRPQMPGPPEASWATQAAFGHRARWLGSHQRPSPRGGWWRKTIWYRNCENVDGVRRFDGRAFSSRTRSAANTLASPVSPASVAGSTPGSRFGPSRSHPHSGAIIPR